MPVRLLKTAARTLALVLAVVAALWIYRASQARQLPDLQIWHTYIAANEFHARDFPNGITYSQYESLEERLFAELSDTIYANSAPLNRFNRYDKRSLAYAGDGGQQWDRSFEIVRDDPVGGILLIHGASDSPYSTRALAELFSDAGLYVLSIRLPGNGTIPSGLREARLEDWLAITRMGAVKVREMIGAEQPFYIAGYSVGGALAVDYALEAAAGGLLPRQGARAPVPVYARDRSNCSGALFKLGRCAGQAADL